MGRQQDSICKYQERHILSLGIYILNLPRCVAQTIPKCGFASELMRSSQDCDRLL